jgi:hypothetical protein
MTGRLSASIEAAGLVRRAQVDGDFAAILHKGDPDRGALLIVVRSRGDFVSCLERTLSAEGAYRWGRVGPSSGEDAKVAQFLTQRTRFDPDLWLIELDIAQPERFIAETTLAG